MRLEQVLARWARATASPTHPAQGARALVSGRWTNEYGSVAEIAVEGDRLAGSFTSATGGAGGPLSGPLSGYVRGDVIAFTVLWPPHMRSLTSWVGQLVDADGVPELRTLWHLIVDIPDPEEASGLWATVHTGADTFR